MLNVLLLMCLKVHRPRCHRGWHRGLPRKLGGPQPQQLQGEVQRVSEGTIIRTMATLSEWLLSLNGLTVWPTIALTVTV